MSPSPLASVDPWDLSQVGTPAIQQEIARPLSWNDLNWSELLSSHWHNRLVHLPLILLAVSLWLAWRSQRAGVSDSDSAYSGKLAYQLLIVSLLLMLPTVITGLLQAPPFESSPKSLFLFWHRNLGLFSAGSLLALTLWRPGGRKQALGSALIVLLMLATGLLGGILGSH